MWTSSAFPCISLFRHQQTHTFIFIFFSSTAHYTLQRLFLLYTFHVSLSSLTGHNQKQVLLMKWVIYFWKLIFLLFSTFWKLAYSQRCFDVDQRYETRRWQYNIVSTLSNIANINVVNFNVGKHVSSVLTNVAKILHIFIKYIKL